ncbi:MAG TPA: tetratricopeptide repeat protein [Casimicrobiaceae bacterium]|nr:tetratricopeptide repeat protein [Casimicrobiaceae bacterium]
MSGDVANTGSGGKPARIRYAIAIAVVAVLGGVAAAILSSDGILVRSSGKGAANLTANAQANHVGGKVCAECHAKAWAAWRGSDHDLAMQVAGEASVLGDFANAKFRYAGTTSTFSRRDGKFFVSTDGPDGKLHDYEIKYTFGVEPLQQYLIEFPGGRMQALSIAWDSRPKSQGGQRWFHLYPGQNIKPGDWLHWTSGGQNWNFTCAECHSTNLRKNFDAKSGTFNTTWAELNVSCEACHGPGSNHVNWARKGPDWRAFDADKGLALALDERRGVTWTPVAGTGNARRSAPRQTSREIEMCARCHGRAARLSDDYVHGKSPLDTHRLALLDDGLYWNDGQMRDEVYNWGSFVQSRMHANGVTCSDCHEPHSLKLREPGNALCAQCHQTEKFDTTGHTRHAPGTPGAACTACHMPTTTFMVVDPRHDHSMRIPRPDLSAKLGIPNACNNCHVRQSPQWAAAAIEKWTGKPPAGFQRFAEALHAGSAGGPGARGALLAIIEDKSQPAIARASAINRLGHLLTPGLVDSLSRGLNDPDAVVRLAAVEALAGTDAATRQRYLVRMLDDPVRAVRIEAARALAGAPEQGLAANQRAAFDKAIGEYIAVQTFNADRPEGRMNLGNLYLQRRDVGAAIGEYRKAIEIDPTFAAAYVNLADLYRAGGADGDAEKTLREGIARNPREAALHHTLGLTLTRQKRSAEALQEFRTAATLAPTSGRYAYVYGVALNSAGKSAEAIKVLNAARMRQPYDRDVLSGLAYFNAQAGKRDAAMGYVRQLRELDPDNAEYAQLARQIAASPDRR